jgi:hypothetical protein
MTRRTRASLVLAFVFAATPAVVLAVEQTKPPAHAGKKIEPQADKMLREMSDYLSHLQNFQVMSSTLDEVVTTDGRKLKVSSDDAISVSRPNRLRSDEVGEKKGMAFRSDGKTMILYCGADNTYATAPSPPTIDATIDTLRDKYKIDAPGADLLYEKPYDGLLEEVNAGQFIGKETVGGVPANHLAFQGKEIDWQIWIQDGPEPLPLRYTITTKIAKGEPEFSIVLTHWQPQATFADDVFKAEPPPGAKQVPTFPTSCGSTHPQGP